MILTPLLMTLVLPVQDPPKPEPPKPVEKVEKVQEVDKVVADSDVDSIFDYLAAKYDADKDGKITQAEYSRGTDFRKVDRNKDGYLTASDFERAGRFPGGGSEGYGDLSKERRESMRVMYNARSVVLAYFHEDASANVTTSSIQFKFQELDMNDDGMIDESEFACATDAIPWGGPGKAWPMMLAAMDVAPGTGGTRNAETDKPDGKIGKYELNAYYSGFADKNGVMRAPKAAGNSGRARRDGQGRQVAADGAPVGTKAPDFKLSPPEGGDAISLSSFAGKKPVALIFGSYT